MVESVAVFPTLSVNVAGVTVTEVISLLTAPTCTTHVAVLLPSSVFTVIVAVPTPTADTSPAGETSATLVVLLDQVYVVFAAAGNTLGINCSFSPGVIETDVLFRLTDTGVMFPATDDTTGERAEEFLPEFAQTLK